jgi:hypothetical protein
MKSLSNEAGSTVVEAAILIPAAMLVLLLAVQACLWAHAATLVQNAAGQADQVATESGGSPAAGVQEAKEILSATARQLVVDPDVEVSQLPGGLVRMAVRGRAESIFPGIDLPVSAVRVDVEQEFRRSG